jgi:hypothetical protein
MKKKIIIPIAVVVLLTVVAVIFILIQAGKPLSGKYDFVYTGRVVVPEPFEYADSLSFENDTVQYNYRVLMDDFTTAIGGTFDAKYAIEGNKITINISDEETVSYDFKRSWNTIYIGDSVWKKSEDDSENEDKISKADKELATYFASVEWEDGTLKITPKRLKPIQLTEIVISNAENDNIWAKDIVLGDDMFCFAPDTYHTEAGSRVDIVGDSFPILLVSDSKDFSPIIIDSFSTIGSETFVTESFIPQKMVIRFKVDNGFSTATKEVTKYFTQ